MSSEPTPTTSISPAAAVLLAIAAVAGTTLAGVIAAQAITSITVYVGVAGFLSALTSVAGVGFIVQLAAERILRRLDRLEAKADEQRQEGYAEGYVAAASGGRHLTAVNQQ